VSFLGLALNSAKHWKWLNMPIGETLTGGLEGIKVEAKCPLYPESGHQRSDLMSFQSSVVSRHPALCI